MVLVAGLKGLNKDHVVVRVVCQHDVVVTDTRAAGEAVHVIGVELAHGLDDNEEFFGALGRELTVDVGEEILGNRLRLGGADTLS